MSEAKAHLVARRLLTIPGVGSVNAFSFVALVEHPNRFIRASQVGAFLELTPKRHQYGIWDWSGRCANRCSRRRLASSVSSNDTHPENWAVRLAERREIRKAAVVATRKIVVLMQTIWKFSADYQWKKEAAAGSEILPLRGREAKSRQDGSRSISQNG
jgi:transposase